MIVLVKINPPDFMDIPPLGLLYVGDALKKAGYEVEVLHISTDEIHRYAQEIVKKRPLYVGYSVFTGTAMRAYARMCREIKESSDIPVVWGNAHPSLLPEECLRESYIDVVVIGEGEETAVELAQAFQGQRELAQVKGIEYKERDGSIRLNPRRPFISDLDRYSLNWELVDVERYLRPFGELRRTIQMVTSRGCPHRCGFCYNLEFNQRRWRAHSVDYVVSQVKQLKDRYGIDGIQFWDDNFFANPKRAFEIVQKIGLPYYAEGRIEYVDDEMARRLAETRCLYFLTGIESGSDRILKMINKDTTVSEIKKNVTALARYPSVWISGSIIFAYPTETRQEFQDTIRLVIDLLDIKKDMVFTSGFYMPYPGSDLYTLAVKEGFRPPQRTEDWEDLDRWASKFELTWVDWITSAETARMRKNLLLLGALYRYDVPLLKRVVAKKLIEGSGHLSGWARLLSWLYDAFFFGGNRVLTPIGARALRLFWKVRRLTRAAAR